MGVPRLEKGQSEIAPLNHASWLTSRTSFSPPWGLLNAHGYPAASTAVVRDLARWGSLGPFPSMGMLRSGPKDHCSTGFGQLIGQAGPVLRANADSANGKASCDRGSADEGP